MRNNHPRDWRGLASFILLGRENRRIRFIENALRFFGSEDDRDCAQVVHFPHGHSGSGYYVFSSEYPDEGSVFLGQANDATRAAIKLARYILSFER